ncbi:MAG: protease family protein [Gaiellales bacterium]|jgi:membrane protease YdiL (CAAX protease family)|nr:protease family protein [Gaiellales bacterium]
MIQGYRMAGPPPHGEPPQPPPERREPGWPAWFGFVGLAVVFMGSLLVQIAILLVTGTGAHDQTPAAADLLGSLVLEAMFIGVALWFASRVKRPHPWQFGLRRTRYWPAVGWAIAGVVTYTVLFSVYVAIAGAPKQSTAQDIGADQSNLALISAGVLFVFLAPVAEEFFFRGFLYGSLRTSLGTAPAAVIAGLVFGLVHATTGIAAVPPLIILGIVFCLLYEKTGSIYPCIALHALNNAFAYAAQTDVATYVAAAFGATAIAACMLVPRFAWRREPAAT